MWLRTEAQQGPRRSSLVPGGGVALQQFLWRRQPVVFPPESDSIRVEALPELHKQYEGFSEMTGEPVSCSATSSLERSFQLSAPAATSLHARTLPSARVAQVKNSGCSWGRPHALPPGPYRLPWRLTFVPGPPPMPKV